MEGKDEKKGNKRIEVIRPGGYKDSIYQPNGREIEIITRC